MANERRNTTKVKHNNWNAVDIEFDPTFRLSIDDSILAIDNTDEPYNVFDDMHEILAHNGLDKYNRIVEDELIESDGEMKRKTKIINPLSKDNMEYIFMYVLSNLKKRYTTVQIIVAFCEYYDISLKRFWNLLPNNVMAFVYKELQSVLGDNYKMNFIQKTTTPSKPLF